MIARVRMAIRVARGSEKPLIRSSRWALAVTVASMPLYVVRFRIGPVPTTLLEVLILLTVVLYVAGHIQARDWHPVRTSLEVPIALLLVAGIVGIAISPNHLGALGFYRAYFIEPILLFYVAIDLLRTRQQFRIVLLGFVTGATIFALLNLGAWAVALIRHDVIQTGNAPEALYMSPNAVAIFLEPPLCVAAGFALYADEARDRYFAITCASLLVTALVFTLSRADLLTLTALAVVVVLTMARRRLRLALLGGAAIGAFAVAQIPYVQQRLAHQLDPHYANNTFEGRLQIWSDTLRMLRDHPLLGAGLRNYMHMMSSYVGPDRLPELYPHNLFLAMWSELGLLGLTTFAVILGMLLWRGWRGFYSTAGFAHPILWGTSAGFIAITVHGLFDTPYFNNDRSAEFWVLAALEVAAIRVFVASERKEVLAALN
jgi:O-antigen ligase